MTPLTVDCARCRQLLPSLHEERPGSDSAEPEPMLAPDDRAFADEHLRACASCAAARAELGVALAALRGLDLQPDDLARLLPAEGHPMQGDELDTRPFVALVVACLIAAAVIVAGITAYSADARATPTTSPTFDLQPGPAPLALSIGGEVGLEVDEEALTLAPRPEELAGPEDVAALEAPPEPDLALAPGGLDADPLALAMVPAPGAPAAADPGAPAAGGAAGRFPAPAPAPAPNVPQPPAPALLAELARLEVSTAISFRDVTLYLVRDPDGRDRMARPRAKAQPPVTREVSPPEPGRAAVRPPSAGAAYRLLPGELLDAPCGLRVAMATTRLTGRTELVVEAAAYDAASAIDGRARRAPVLKAPVLVPSRARAALVAEPPSAAVGAFVTSLADPSILEFRRLREALDAIEPVALDLERRLHAQLDDARGLRGLAVSIAPGDGAGRDGPLRSVDLVGSAKELSEVLPRLLRAALLEAALDHPRDDGPMGDPRPANLANGPATDPLRTTIRDRLTLFAQTRRAPDAAPDAPYTASTPTTAATLAVATRGGELLHGAVLTR